MTNEKVKTIEPEVPRIRPISKSIAATATHWRTLANNLRDALPDMPHLAAEHAEFERLVARVESSLAEQNILQGRISVLIRGRVVDLEQGRELRSRLTAQLQGRFGSKSEALRQFGIKPRKRSKTRKQIEGEPQVPEPEKPEPENPEPTPTIVKIE
jgi:hypothetical protein